MYIGWSLREGKEEERDSNVLLLGAYVSCNATKCLINSCDVFDVIIA